MRAARPLGSRMATVIKPVTSLNVTGMVETVMVILLDTLIFKYIGHPKIIVFTSTVKT